MDTSNPILFDLSIVVPVYNEEANIPELYARLKVAASKVTSRHEIIFINDGSKDLSLLGLMQLAEQDKQVFYINFSRNFGHQIAVTAGLDKCRGQAVVIIDGDLQDPPEIIPDMYKIYQEGYQCVYAKRTARKGESYFKKLTAKFFYRILKNITDVHIPIDTGDFRLIDKKIVDLLKQMPEQNKFLRGQISWLGFKQTAIDYQRDERKAGVTGYPLKKMIRFALDGITAFSDMPLKFVTNTGIFISFLAFIVILYALYSNFILHQTISGWTSLIISILFIGGIQLVSIGIIGEYINRINKNVRNRPLYIIEQDNFKN
jgi:polyisoprenyl-phosphate glycosyltransferase